MSLPVIRPFPIYFNNKKIAEVSQGTYDIAPGDEAQIGTDGYLGHSDGATITKIDATVIVPVKGLGVTILASALAKKYVSIGIVADGKSHQMDMRITHLAYDWDSKTGRATGKVTFEGGSPDTTG